jgi:photosystem II stability/assembly factor-like uncharacterized protein
MPPALPGEAAHATGTCLVTVGSRDAWLGTSTGVGTNSRVFHTRDGGRTWTVATTPIPGEPTFGIASLSFRDRRHGVAVGGSSIASDAPSTVAVTADGGRTWSRAGSPAGFRITIAWVPTDTPESVVTVGPSGSDFSRDGGHTWRRFDQTLLLGVNCPRHVTCWAVGGNGVAADLALRRS